MEFNIGWAVGAFIALFLVYCLFLFVRGLFKSSPMDYFRFINLENKFKNHEYDYMNEKGENILMQAIHIGSETLALDIIKSGKVDIFNAANDGSTAFFLAVICDNIKLVKALVKAGEKIEPKKCGKFGSPLLWACRAGSIELIDYFLNHGAKVNRQVMRIKYSPLMGACFTLKDEAILHMLEKGADKNLKSKDKKIAKDIYINSGGKNKKILNVL